FLSIARYIAAATRLHYSPFTLSLTIPRPPSSTLFPYTTLFRSRRPAQRRARGPEDHPARYPALRRRPRVRLGGVALDNEQDDLRSEEHTSELQSRFDLVCRLLLEKKNYMVLFLHFRRTRIVLHY